jgi:hypothetical protein
MIWVFILVSSIWIGYEFVNIFAPSVWDQLSVLSAGIPVGITAVTWLFFLVRFFRPLDRAVGLIVSLALLVVSSVAHRWNLRKPKFRRLSPEFLITFFCFSVLFYFLCDISYLKNGRHSSGTTFSDLPFHLSLISSFAYGGNSLSNMMWTPFYLGAPLSYPIIPDFFSAVLVGCGSASLRVSIAVPSLILLVSLLFVLHDIAGLFSDRRFVAELSIFFFMMAAGVGWKWAFNSECRGDVNANMAHYFCARKETFWIHSLIHYLLPQRSGLFSIAICILLIAIFVYEVQNNLGDSKAFVLAGVMMGFLPCLSAHSFIGVGEYAGLICVLNFPWKVPRRAITQWAKFGCVAMLIALPQILWLMPTHRRDFFMFKPIWWETNSTLGFFTMWWESLGAFVMLSIFHVWLYMSSHQRLMYFPALGVFVVSNFLRYQPGAMDNTKVFLCAWYPLACLAVADYLIATLLKTPRIVVKAAVCFVTIGFVAGSVICIYKALMVPFPVFEEDEMMFGVWVMQNTRRDAKMLARGWHGSPMMSIGGRIITMGYGGWVWSHGLDYKGRRSWCRDMADDRENVTRFDEAEIAYAVYKYSENEESLFPISDPYSHWMQVVAIENAGLYRLVHN